MSARATAVIVLGLLMTSIGPRSFAAEADRVGVTDTATILDGEGHARILAHWTPLAQGERVAIRRAILRFELQNAAIDRSTTLMVYPLTRAWNASSVRWTEGWAEPGGDIDHDSWSHTRLDLGRSAGPIEIDITRVVESIAESSDPIHGFLVTVDASEGAGLRESDLPRLAGIAQASIEVDWRLVPPAPRADRTE